MFVLVAKPQLKRIPLTVRRDKPHSTSEHARVLVDFCKVNNLFQTLEGLHDYACHVHVYSRCHILFLLEGDVWFQEQLGMKIISHSTTPVKRIADSPPPTPLFAYAQCICRIWDSLHKKCSHKGQKKWGSAKELFCI